MRTEDAVKAFINSRKARGLSPRTVEWYSGFLTRLANDYPDLPAAPETMEEFMGGLKVVDESLYSYYRGLKAFFRWCSRRCGTPDPMLGIDPPRRRKKTPRTLAMTELAYLMMVPLSKRDRALVNLLVDTGVRISEARTLRVEDIAMETIFVTGKTGEHEVPISDETRRMLLELAPSGYLFPGKKGPLCRQQANRIVWSALKAAGVTGRRIGPHTLRHTFGRHFIAQSGDLVSLQRILGHSNITTTRRYAEMITGDIIRQHHRYSPLKEAMAPVQGRLLDDAENYLRTVSREE